MRGVGVPRRRRQESTPDRPRDVAAAKAHAAARAAQPMNDILIVGGGVIGASVAWRPAERGLGPVSRHAPPSP